MVSNKQKTEKSVAVWHPFQEIEEMGRHFEDFFGSPFLPAIWRRFPGDGKAWSPAIDVMEKDKEYIVKAELPGVKEEDVDISISGNMLTISGEKETESETKKKGYYYSESSYGSFSRSVTIPSNVNTDKIEACYDKGILEITLPKTAEAKTKKVKVAEKKKA
jgi:HSP20 family protein